MVWFRRSLNLSAAQAAGTAALSLGAIDEVDETWVNGRAVGNSFGWGTERTYQLPAGVLHAGENLIVVNVLSTWDAGGMYGPPEHMALRCADGSSVALGGQWRYQFVADSMGYPPRSPWESIGGLSSLHNAMIAPLEPYGLRGVLWYQGESNVGNAAQYQQLLAGLKDDWRRKFSSALPFLIVELPNFGAPPVAPLASDWASLREAQRRAVADDPLRSAGRDDRYRRPPGTCIHPTSRNSAAVLRARLDTWSTANGFPLPAPRPRRRGANRTGSS